MQCLTLKKNEDRRLNAGHLWIYSNEIDVQHTPLKNFQLGELVIVTSNTGKKLGIAYVNSHTLLCARLLTTNVHTKIDVAFFKQRIQAALNLRESMFAKPCYRLIFGESDLLPGLVVDRYHDILVAQLTTAGTENLKPIILEALIEVVAPRAILWRNDTSARDLEGLTKYVAPAYGEPPKNLILEENELFFNAAIWEGQKTGWFYDQRNNRTAMRPYIKNARVLDVCSYSGSWGINAAKFGALEVTCLDASTAALEAVTSNAELNNLATKIRTIADDVFTALPALATAKEQFDVIILDPPAFIKKRKDMAAGYKAYLRLHQLALALLSANGTLITTSCSQHLSRDDLLDVVRQASLNQGKHVTIVEQLQQAPDHPIHPAIAETYYLKGFIAKLASQ